MPASRMAARSALQVVLRCEHNVGTFVVVILAGYECRWAARRLGCIILHALFSQALLTKFAQAAKEVLQAMTSLAETPQHAPRPCGQNNQTEKSWGCGPPKVMKKRLGSATTLYRTVALPFCHPVEADLSRPAVERSAVPQASPGNVFRPSVAEGSAVSGSHTPYLEGA